MTAYGVIEPGIVGLIVAASAWTALAKLAPAWKDRLLGRSKPSSAGDCGTCGGCERAVAHKRPTR